MTFRLHDSATHETRTFLPLVPGKVSIYHCGLTVQSAPHVGHIRKEVVFDVLRRWLTHRGLDVTVVANITDIDDKILAKSAAAGVPWYAHAYTYERALHEAYAALGCQPPTYEPRATGHIPEMLELIATLVRRGHAYPALDDSGDVYFDVSSWPAYGSLSNQSIDDMESAPDAEAGGKRDPRDFALWKGHKPTEPITASWPSPWGRGRPGWHLECSAMAGKYLGEQFDIHGGGLDLRFPHHENELAQSTAAGQRFAQFWMHNGLVTAKGEKMSKSLGNGALVSEVVKVWPPRAVRLWLVQPHYRSVVEWSQESLAEATQQLERIDGFLTRASRALGEVAPAALPEAFVDAMDDDLSTPQAVAVIFTRVREGNQALAEGDTAAASTALAEVRAMLGVLGLDPDGPEWASTARTRQSDLAPVVDALVGQLLTQRREARARQDWAAADAIRDALGEAGLVLTDTPDGTEWTFDPSHQHDPEEA